MSIRCLFQSVTLIQLLLCFNVNTPTTAFGWSPSMTKSLFVNNNIETRLHSSPQDTSEPIASMSNINTRRSFLNGITGAAGISTLLSISPIKPAVAAADEKEEPKRKSLDDCIYMILRVREATFQETRLISTGKFKDVQRANVKLAVKFMIQNYRLNDNLIAASAYLEGSKRIQAGDIGQQAVQSLFTILEYFDSSDVQNIKVDSSGMAGKETIVLKGLEVTRSRLDDFLALFPAEVVEKVRAKIKEENDLNASEFDPAIGVILNPNPTK